MSNPETKSEVEAAFDEVYAMTPLGHLTSYEQLELMFAAGAKFVADLNQEKIKQLIKDAN